MTIATHSRHSALLIFMVNSPLSFAGPRYVLAASHGDVRLERVQRAYIQQEGSNIHASSRIASAYWVSTAGMQQIFIAMEAITRRNGKDGKAMREQHVFIPTAVWHNACKIGNISSNLTRSHE
ncbi:hypothetical protein [Paraburkholderia sp. C35]|uniref:hypothetical protein n=1 Tax=Paraburkholderia sp. C35 TaxID=2126993 RepID=UPI0013A5BA3C|nr:hypothetical protein [Paraburkholderia sp. C35]